MHLFEHHVTVCHGLIASSPGKIQGHHNLCMRLRERDTRLKREGKRSLVHPEFLYHFQVDSTGAQDTVFLPQLLQSPLQKRPMSLASSSGTLQWIESMLS